MVLEQQQHDQRRQAEAEPDQHHHADGQAHRRARHDVLEAAGESLQDGEHGLRWLVGLVRAEGQRGEAHRDQHRRDVEDDDRRGDDRVGPVARAQNTPRRPMAYPPPMTAAIDSGRGRQRVGADQRIVGDHVRERGRESGADEPSGTDHHQRHREQHPGRDAERQQHREDRDDHGSDQVRPDDHLPAAPPVEQRAGEGPDDRIGQQQDREAGGDVGRRRTVRRVEQHRIGQRALERTVAEGGEQPNRDQPSQARPPAATVPVHGPRAAAVVLSAFVPGVGTRAPAVPAAARGRLVVGTPCRVTLPTRSPVAGPVRRNAAEASPPERYARCVRTAESMPGVHPAGDTIRLQVRTRFVNGLRPCYPRPGPGTE